MSTTCCLCAWYGLLLFWCVLLFWPIDGEIGCPGAGRLTWHVWTSCFVKPRSGPGASARRRWREIGSGTPCGGAIACLFLSLVLPEREFSRKYPSSVAAEIHRHVWLWTGQWRWLVGETWRHVFLHGYGAFPRERIPPPGCWRICLPLYPYEPFQAHFLPALCILPRNNRLRYLYGTAKG